MPDQLNRLINVIDQLIDEELADGPRDGDIGQTCCQLCGGEWHGATADPGNAREHGRIPYCPGALATDAQRAEWQRQTARRPATREGAIRRCHDYLCNGHCGNDNCPVAFYLHQ